MLIIFDLDDTLIETSACLAKPRFHEAIIEMKKAGMEIVDVEESLKVILDINKTTTSSKETLKQFLFSEENIEKYFEKGLYHLYKAPLSNDIKIFAVDNANEVLRELQRAHSLCLVTAGDSVFQKEKMEKAGIDCSLFSKIDMIAGNNKKECYQNILKLFKHDPKKIVVCGDKVEIDLMPAKELGCNTILIRKGRGKNVILPHLYVDYEIEELIEIITIITNMSIL